MKEDKQYHIDVTPEEDKLFRDIEAIKQEQKFLKPKSNLNVIALVIALHVVGACALMAFSSKEDKQIAENILNTPSLEECAIRNQSVDHSTAPPQEPEPTPTPIVHKPIVPITPQEPQPASLPSMDVPMDGKLKEDPPTVKTAQQKKAPPSSTQVSKLMKEYVVKKGDTVYSIAKKFKLRTDRLLQLNGIKDPNKIVEGQKLKFL